MVLKKQKRDFYIYNIFQQSYNKLYPSKQFSIDENIAENILFRLMPENAFLQFFCHYRDMSL